MSEAYIGEIRVFGFNFAPVGWFFCDGQTLPIQQYTALFSIIGTFYGGNGTTTFALPNFQGRSGVHQGTGTGLSTYDVGEQSGQSTVTLTQGQMPMHNHVINTRAPATATQEQRVPTAGQSFLGSSKPDDLYSSAAPSPAASFSPAAIGMSGQSLPHDNMQPYQVLNFCICYDGYYPSRN
jgi:microcystin-dependent protein